MVHSAERPKNTDSPKSGVGEIDTRAPFQSVKDAVNLFGEVAFSGEKPAIKKAKPQSAERALVKETELHLAQKELNKLKEQLRNAEDTKAEALVELEKAKKTVESLAHKLKYLNESKEAAIQATEAAKQHAKQLEDANSAKQAVTNGFHKEESGDTKEKYTTVISELNAAKQELAKVRQDYDTSLEAKATAHKQAAEAEHAAKANTERASELSKEIFSLKETIEQVRQASISAHQEQASIFSEKDLERRSYKARLEESVKKLQEMKKEFDPENSKDLEGKLAEALGEIEVLRTEVENSKASDVDSVRTVTLELDDAKESLQKVLGEGSALQSLVNSLKEELENLRKEHAELKEKEAETESIAGNLHVKLRKCKSELEASLEEEAKASGASDEMTKYQSSERIDQLRLDEYGHLTGPAAKVCLDYCGFGLFSHLQTLYYWDTSSFSLSEMTANLSNHVLYGGAERGTVEHDIKTRIIDYLNIPENEYGIVFTVSRGSAFKLLAEAYPFHTNKKLLTMFDHESQSVNWMAQAAKEKGAKSYSAWFKWPTLKPCSADLRKQILNKKKRKKDSAVGLFAFPVQSRVTGSKYSYQWMALAQQNNWHVLLDAGALGPKDMDSLGLSLFRPDFIITSFYRVFGFDPSGFGCLLIKKSVLGCLQNQSGVTGTGMVKITPVFPQYLGDSMDGLDGLIGVEDDEVDENGDFKGDTQKGSQMPAFSGAFTHAQVKDVFDTEMEHENSSDRDGASTIFEETESISVGEVMKSPIFSEDESSDNSFWIDLGQSPMNSEHVGHLERQRSTPSPPLWFTGRKDAKRVSPKPAVNKSRSPTYDGRHMLSFDAAVQSVSRGVDNVHEINEEIHTVHEIEEEYEHEMANNKASLHSSLNGDHYNGHTSTSRGITSELCAESKESAIRRETEGEFRLLGRRDGNKFAGGRVVCFEEDDIASKGRRVSFSTEDNHRGHSSHTLEAGETSARDLEDYDYASDGDYGDDPESDRREPEIICRHLDHINMLGLNRTTSRLRFLINWLVTSLLQLRFPGPDEKNDVPLVQIYGPKIKYERGAAVAFNVRNCNRGLINPEVVQKLAEAHGIGLGVGILSHMRIMDGPGNSNGELNITDTTLCKPMANGRFDGKSGFFRVEVVTASLSFLSNFDDVYKLWAFVAKFLNPAFTREIGLPTVEEESET